MCGWLRASMSGLTRTATRARMPRAAAIASIRSSSPSDSALMLRRPRSIARASSASVLPTPVKTISAGVKPARSATSISPTGIGVGGGAEAAQQAGDGQRRVGLQRVVQRVRVAGERLVDLAVDGRRSSRRCRRRAVCRSGRRGPRAARRRSGAHPGAVRMKTRSFDSTVPHAELGTPADVWVESFLVLFRPTPEADDDCCQPRSPRNSVLRGEARCRLTRPPPATTHARHADRAMPRRRSGRLGSHRPAELAEGLQRRLQVRRQARRSRRSDPGHLPEDLQGAAHVRPARQLSDLDRQHQPEPLHRSLPQRAQGTADDRARRRFERSAAGVDRARAVCRRRAPGPARAAAHRARQAAGDAAHRGGAARPAGIVVSGNRRPARAAGRHREVAYQPRPARAGASAEAAAGQAAGGDARRERPESGAAE